MKVNFNTKRLQELFHNSLRNFSSELYFPSPIDIDDEKKFIEFDDLPENHSYNENETIRIVRYNPKGEPIAVCSIRQKYLKLIIDKALNDENHEYNLFNKYAFLSKQET